MGWTVGVDLDAHRRAVEAFLAAEPVEHTSQATILATLASGVSWSEEPPVFAVHRTPDGVVDGSAVATPPHPLVLDGAADPAGLVAALGDRALGGVNAPVPVAEAFAAAWCTVHPAPIVPDHRLHLLELLDVRDLLDPPRTDRELRPATAGDLPRIHELVRAMRTEIGESGPTPAQIMIDRLATGLLWVVSDDGAPVAMANATVAVAGVSRVAGVYTVPAHRGRGYAAAVTAAVTRAGFAAGARQLCLFTDAANPTSNGVYERLGYRRRPHDRVVLRFR